MTEEVVIEHMEEDGEEENEEIPLRNSTTKVQEVVLVNPIRLSKDKEEVAPVLYFLLGVWFIQTPIVPLLAGFLGWIFYMNSSNKTARTFSKLNFGLSWVGLGLLSPSLVVLTIVMLPSAFIALIFLGIFIFSCWGTIVIVLVVLPVMMMLPCLIGCCRYAFD